MLAVALTSSAELQSGAERMCVKAFMQKLCLHLDSGPSLGGGVNYVAPLIDRFSARAPFFYFSNVQRGSYMVCMLIIAFAPAPWAQGKM